MAVVVHSAAIQDRDGAKLLFFKAVTLFPTISLIWADGGYAGKLGDWLKCWCSWVLTIVRKLGEQVGFQILPKRWIVERTFGWFFKSRRLCRDYEVRLDHSEAMIRICIIRLMVRRLASAL